MEFYCDASVTDDHDDVYEDDDVDDDSDSVSSVNPAMILPTNTIADITRNNT